MSTIAIIGAGISGLSCARLLATAGHAVTVFEKSRSLGGRCATRRWNGHIVDHGAQYFTMRDEGFRDEIERLCGDALRAIETPFLDAAGGALPVHTRRWYHVLGNNRLAKPLLGHLPIQMETTVPPPQMRGEKWEVAGALFDAVVSSAPLPQSLGLLGRDPVDDPYQPCLTAFYSYQGEWAGNTAQCYARLDKDSALAWSACENHKMARITPGQTVLVAQAGPEFSQRNFAAEPDVWAAELRDLLEARWNLPAGLRLATFTHRWRFARLVQPVAPLALPPRFFLTGDAFSESRVEAAWLAGVATGHEVLAAL